MNLGLVAVVGSSAWYLVSYSAGLGAVHCSREQAASRHEPMLHLSVLLNDAASGSHLVHGFGGQSW